MYVFDSYISYILVKTPAMSMPQVHHISYLFFKTPYQCHNNLHIF